MGSKTSALDATALQSLRAAIEDSVAAHARIGDAGSNGYLRLASVSTQAVVICEALQKEAIQQARHADHSWAEIGALMGITRQAAQQRFALDRKAGSGDAGKAARAVDGDGAQ
jgi:hypothetical protein